MRRSDRQITDFNEILNFVDSCTTIRVGVLDEKYPYIIPLSFGFEAVGDEFIFYIHSAAKGKKVDLFSKYSNVCVETDLCNGYVNLNDGVTTDYFSFIGFGEIRLCNGAEKIKGLDLIMKHCGYEGFPDGKCDMLEITNVYKITVAEYTAKKRFD